MMTATASAELDALVDDHFEAEIDGDLSRLLATFADDVEHDVVGSPSVSTGKDAVKAFYRELFTDMRFDSIEPVRRYYGEAFMVDESVVTARAVGNPFGMPGGGRTLQFRLLHVFEIRGGQITRENTWIDTASVFAQLAGDGVPSSA